MWFHGEKNKYIPESFFLIVILHLAWLVMSLKGVKSSLMVDFASILTVCHDNSLKINNSPRSVSLTRVIRKSDFCHVGDLDSKTIRDIWKKKWKSTILLFWALGFFLLLYKYHRFIFYLVTFMSVILTLLWPGTGGQKWKNNVLKILHFYSNNGPYIVLFSDY